MPIITETAMEIAAAVYGELNDSEKAELTEGIREARLADDDASGVGDEVIEVSDDWYCIMMQNECSPRGLDERRRLVTKADLMLTILDMSAAMPTAGIDWGRMLLVWQDRANYVRVSWLFEAAAARMLVPRPAVLRRVREAHAHAERARI